MICQSCGAYNRDPGERCVRCQQKLLVVSGVGGRDGELFTSQPGDEQQSFDEHLLERISSLEEALERTTRTVQELLGVLDRQERTILVNQSALATARELLERRGVVLGEEWDELWQQHSHSRLVALEKRQRFLELASRLKALYRGDRRREFESRLSDAEFALYAYDLPRAIASLEGALELDPGHGDLACFLGELLFNEGEADRALECFRRALLASPDNVQALVFAGILRHEMGEPEAAAKLLERAVGLEPEAFLPRLGLGAAYATLGRSVEAQEQFARAVEIDPVPQALFLLGSSLYEGGRLVEATGRLEETVRLDPAFEEAHHLLGLAYLDKGWKRKALAAFRRAKELNPRKLHYQQLVRFLAGSGGDPLPAVEGRASALLERGELLAGRGRLQEAIVCLGRALELEADHPTLLLTFARRALEAGRPEESRRAAGRAMELAGDEMLRVTAAATLIEGLRCGGDSEEGRRLAEALLAEVETEFGRTVAYCELAWTLAELGEELERALQCAQRAVEHAPEELAPFPLAALGWVHYKRGEFGAAVEALARSSELEPSAGTLTHLGMALAAEGRRDEAREVLERARRAEEGWTSLEQRMMECVRDSSRLYERVLPRRAG